MARISMMRWIGLAGLVAGAACQSAPPFEEVTDPFAPLPQAQPVISGPLAAPGVISDEVITPASGAPVSAFDDTGTDAGGASEPPEAGGLSDTVTEVNASGLVERLPNTCQLENYQQYQGTEGLIAVGLVTDRPARLVEPGDIVSQVYDPQRVNFYTDRSGRVARISCG